MRKNILVTSQSSPDTRDEIIYKNTKNYLAKLDRNNLPTTAEIKAALLDATCHAIEDVNRSMTIGRKRKIPNTLSVQQIAMLAAFLFPIYDIRTHGTRNRTFGILGVYNAAGNRQGLYSMYSLDPDLFASYIRQLNWDITPTGIKRVAGILPELVPQKEICRDPNLIPVDNGIIDRNEKTLLPFSPEYVFLEKRPEKYIMNDGEVCIAYANGKIQELNEWLEGYKPSILLY